MIWPRAQPTCSGCRPLAVTAAPEAPAWRNSLRPFLKVQKRTTEKCFSSFVQRQNFTDVCLLWFFLGRLAQNNTAVIFGTAVGGAAMLFIVVVVLFLCRRSVNAPLCCPPCLSFLLINENTLSFTGFLSHSSALPLWGLQMAFAFTLSSPLSFSLPLANFLLLFI